MGNENELLVGIEIEDGGASLNDLNRELFRPKDMHKKWLIRGRNDNPSYLELLRKFKLKELYNFYFTKKYVPTGEGHYRALHQRLIKYPDLAPLPQYIEMETTTICDKKCVMCEVTHWPKGDQDRRHLRLDEFQHMVNQFPELRWTNLTGMGSSFLNPDYTKMLKYLHEKHNTSIWLVDHLVHMSIEQMEKEVFPYIHGIYVSFDAALKETYEKIKVGCSYDLAVNNLKNIIEYKHKKRTSFPHLTFRYVMMKETIGEMPAFLDLLNSIATQKQWGGSSTMVEFTGLLYFKEIMDMYVEKVPQDIIEQLKLRKKGLEFQFSHPEEDRNPPIENCVAWLEPYYMLPGYVMPCCAVLMSNNRPFLKKYAFGNALEQDIKDIWHNEYYTKFRSMVNNPDAPVPKICAGCRAYRTKHRIKKHGIWDIHAESETQNAEACSCGS